MSLIGRSFLHASDLHLGFPLGELKDCDQLSDQDLKLIVKEMQGAFDNLIQVAIDNNVLFVVLAGDIYHDLDSQDALQADFRNGLLKLEEHGIGAYIIHGNHDPSLKGYKPRRELPDNVHVFRTDEPHEFIAAQTDEGIVSVAGVSFGSTAVTENLSVGFRNLSRENAKWRVGVLHTSMAGNSAHDTYAPCSVEDLRAAPVGYWALGHIHLRNDSNSLGDGRWWAYSGNLQGRNFKPAECHPKGALLVTLNRNGFDAPKFVACDTVRFQNIQIDVSEIDEFDDCSRLLIKEVLTASNSLENRRLVVRVELIGRSFLHKEIRTQVENGKMQKDFLGDFKSEIGSTIVAGITSTVKPTYDLNELRQEQGLIGTTLRILDQMSDEEVLAESKKLVVATASECLGDDDAVAIRERTAMALVEAILEGNKKS
jgi:DNA repair exonuclease SbcCD nuclease subunit